MNIQTLLRSWPARLIQHLAFWGLSYYVLVHVFASSSEIQTTDHVYTAIFLFTIAIWVCINLFILIPVFLNKGRFVLYGILVVLCIFSATYLNQLTFSHIIDYLLPGYYFISYFEFVDILKFMAAFIGLTSLIKLSKGYFNLLETRNELLKVQKENSEAELQALRAQVNPHFLFNSLNSIYAMVLKRSENAADMILRLSGILRYILYETRKERVELSVELDHMLDYVTLQKIRSDPKVKIEARINGEPKKIKIAPLLFLPLIENCFKHGIKGEISMAYVTMEWTIDRGLIRFVAENNKGGAEKNPLDPDHGIGLENLKKRLNMTYPGKHHFNISETEDRFIAELIIHS